MFFFIIPKFLYFPAYGNESDILNKLLENGVLTSEEVIETKKLSAEFQPALTSEAKFFKVIVYAQLRCMVVKQNYSDSSGDKSIANQGSCLRRQVWGFLTNIDENTDYYLSINTAVNDIFDSAYITHRVNGDFLKGIIRIGYYIPDFTMEDPSGAKIKTPDRSIINTYWGGKDSYSPTNTLTRTANQCFGGNHLGVYGNWLMPFDEKFFVNMAITNSRNAHWQTTRNNLDLAYWISSGFSTKTEEMSLKTGINFGYSSNLTSVHNPVTNSSKECESFGVSTYLILQMKNLFVEAEAVMTTTEHNKILSDSTPLFSTQSGTSTPFGGFLAIGYTFNIGKFGEIEPIVRYSYLNSNGAGVSESNVLYRVNSTGYYDVVHSFFCGVNWYIRGNAIKIQAGLENLHFSGNPTGGADKSAITNVGIVQFQVMF